jgi:hypothetical protein
VQLKKENIFVKFRFILICPDDLRVTILPIPISESHGRYEERYDIVVKRGITKSMIALILGGALLLIIIVLLVSCLAMREILMLII